MSWCLAVCYSFITNSNADIRQPFTTVDFIFHFSTLISPLIIINGISTMLFGWNQGYTPLSLISASCEMLVASRRYLQIYCGSKKRETLTNFKDIFFKRTHWCLLTNSCSKSKSVAASWRYMEIHFVTKISQHVQFNHCSRNMYMYVYVCTLHCVINSDEIIWELGVKLHWVDTLS